MVKPFQSIIGQQLDATTKSHEREQPDRENAREANDNFAQGPGSDMDRYLDRATNLKTLRIPLVKFPGMKLVVPQREWTCNGLQELADEIAPSPAPVFERKDRLPYYIGGTLRDAELANRRLREERQCKGQSTIGRQRSSAHIESLGPALFLDEDGDVFARLPILRVLGVAAIVYSSYSYAFTKTGATQASASGRIVLPLNRPVTPSEYPDLWDGVNDLLGGGFDEHGRSPAQCYGRHARRAVDAPYRREILDGYALNADALIERGRSLRPERPDGFFATSRAARKCAALEQFERARLMGALRPPDEYREWIAGAAAFKRALSDDVEAAFQCFDIWSAASTKYDGLDQARRKFDQVPAEYTGCASPVTIDMLHWRARRRAEITIGTMYSPAAKWTVPAAFSGLPTESLGAGSTQPHSSDDTVAEKLTPEHGILALTYLLVCWHQSVFDRTTAGLSIPEPALKEVERRAQDVRERIALAGRTRHRWSGENLSADTRALADAIVGATKDLYRTDRLLVRVIKPAADTPALERIQKIYGRDGRPGRRDPAEYAGHRLTPILPSDSEALRELIAENVAAEFWVKDKGRGGSTPIKIIASFGFKPSAKIHKEPDAAVLKDLLKRELATRVPEINGIITAPVMPDLPRSTNSSDLLQAGTDRILADPGFDARSGLYLSPVGNIVPVPNVPTRAEVEAAAALILEPLVDFPFVSPGEGLDAEVSRAAVVYAIMLATNRRALPIAPGLAISSHGEGMSSGKTLLGESVCTIATGDLPPAVSLSSNFTEQQKEILTFLLEGDGSLFLDNVPNGTRFDSAGLAAAMTSQRFKGRLLGANKQIECSTRAMCVATGNSLNLAGDLASRFLLSRLNTGLERPEDRSASSFKIPDLRPWIVDNRQRIVAAVHTITRAYLQKCRRIGGTPETVATRRATDGSRFGGPCDLLRDALLWAFPDLPDPFLSFQASAANSSTKAEAALVLSTLDLWMRWAAGDTCAPQWARTATGRPIKSPKKWAAKFRARWSALDFNQQCGIYGTGALEVAETNRWVAICAAVKQRLGRNAVRTGRVRFTGAQIAAAFQNTSGGETLRAATHADKLNAVALGRWLRERLVDAPINGLVLRSALRRDKTAEYWIAWERSK
jgi:Primase C terminal 2 (PriCT-2)